MLKSQFLKPIVLSAITIFAASWSSAAEPEGYYSAAYGRSGKNLLTSLHDIIDDHHNVGYDGLWQVYYTSDVREDGTLWDMYSTKHWTWGNKQCGNYKNVGDCYNREHSMPKSWFDDRSPMVSDAFHIYPTDGKVNGQRSNYPFGECSGGTTLPSNCGVRALGRLGTCTFPGYSGTVFEPDDEYKGDFARTYFYMATRYNDLIAGWSSPMLAGNSYPAYT
ncbi:MAG: endonuclease, partial [Muribaculaceae bacterium]|nr:endonuclease [Muribaculaceae bacterium]